MTARKELRCSAGDRAGRSCTQGDRISAGRCLFSAAVQRKRAPLAAKTGDAPDPRPTAGGLVLPGSKPVAPAGQGMPRESHCDALQDAVRELAQAPVFAGGNDRCAACPGFHTASRPDAPWYDDAEYLPQAPAGGSCRGAAAAGERIGPAVGGKTPSAGPLRNGALPVCRWSGRTACRPMQRDRLPPGYTPDASTGQRRAPTRRGVCRGPIGTAGHGRNLTAVP